MTMVRDKRAVKAGSEKQISLGPVKIGLGVDKSFQRSLPYRAFNKLTGRTPVEEMRAGAAMYRAGYPADKPITPRSAPRTPEAQAIIDKITGYDWYHTIELPHGVTTPGYVDHRMQLPFYHLPEDMTGMRVLDVATFDGYWAYEFERRGAEVVGIDVDDTHSTDVPRNWRDRWDSEVPKIKKGQGFKIASEILGSKVKYEVCSVYDISPERLGMFDMVFLSDLLIHLRDPLHAMESIWGVTKNFAVFADVYNPDLDKYTDEAMVQFCWAGQGDVWWQPSVTTYKLWAHLARFSRVEEKSRFVLESNFQRDIPKVVLFAYK